MKIQARMMYMELACKEEAVKACCSLNSRSFGHLKSPLAEFVLRLEAEDDTKMFYDTIKGHPTITLVPEISALSGPLDIQLNMKFSELSSCVGCMNRREVAVVFTLLHSNISVGSKIIPVKICALPWRDSKIEEERARKLTEVFLKEERSEPVEKMWVLACGKKNIQALCDFGFQLEKGREGGNTSGWSDEVDVTNRSVISSIINKSY